MNEVRANKCEIRSMVSFEHDMAKMHKDVPSVLYYSVILTLSIMDYVKKQ